MMNTKLHDTLTEALESLKARGLIRKYSPVWTGRSEAPRISLWKAADVPDDALRHTIAGIVAESELTIEKE